MARRRLIGALLFAIAFIGGLGVASPDGANTEPVGSVRFEGDSPHRPGTVQPQVDG